MQLRMQSRYIFFWYALLFIVVSSPVPAVPASQPGILDCRQAKDAGYSLIDDYTGNLYKVKTTAGSGTTSVHVFFDKRGTPVTDSVLLRKLAVAAWVRENVVDSSAVHFDLGNKRNELQGIIDTSQSMEHYEQAQDLLARALAAALAAYATGGASIAPELQTLPVRYVQSQLVSPNGAKIVLTLTGRVGLKNSMGQYAQLEELMPVLERSEVRTSDLLRARDLYFSARGLELQCEPLLAAMMPQRASDLVAQGFKSMLSEVTAGLPTGAQYLTEHDLINFSLNLANAGGTSGPLKRAQENMKMAFDLTNANNRQISEWASAAATACGGAQPRAGSEPVPTFAFANTNKTQLLAEGSWSASQKTVIGPSPLLDRALCGNQFASIQYVGEQKAGPNNSGRDVAANFEQLAGYKYRVLNGHAADEDCLLATKDYFADKALLSIAQVTPAGACSAAIQSRLTQSAGRPIQKCGVVGKLQTGEVIVVAEFQRHGNDLLAAIAVTRQNSMAIREMKAKYDPQNQSGWSVDDQGKMLLEQFLPVWALRNHNTGELELEVNQAGSEGYSRVLYKVSGIKIEETHRSYRYTLE